MTTLKISNKEMKYILELFKYLEDLEEFGISNESVTRNNENEVREQKGGFFLLLAATLGTNIFANTLGKAIMPGLGVIRAVKGTIKAEQDF